MARDGVELVALQSRIVVQDVAPMTGCLSRYAQPAARSAAVSRPPYRATDPPRPSRQNTSIIVVMPLDIFVGAGFILSAGSFDSFVRRSGTNWRANFAEVCVRYTLSIYEICVNNQSRHF